MDPSNVAERLARAEAEFRAAQREHDGSVQATVRYQAARSELVIAEQVVRAILGRTSRDCRSAGGLVR